MKSNKILSGLAKIVFGGSLVAGLVGCSQNEEYSRNDLKSDVSKEFNVSFTDYCGKYGNYDICVTDYKNNIFGLDLDIYSLGNEIDPLVVATDEDLDGRFDTVEIDYELVPKGHDVEKYFNLDSLNKIRDYVLKNYTSKEEYLSDDKIHLDADKVEEEPQTFNL